jgi:CO/xanthine dehydrogenase FAD-binding subunit
MNTSYVRAASFEEAYNALQETKAKIVGGGLFIRLQKSTSTLIDIQDLKLDYINIDSSVEIGAMTCLRALEVSDVPKVLVDSVKQISGVGVRNVATIGGSVMGRYPFSDINVALLALNAELEFYKSGRISFREFNEKGMKEKDILKSIHFELPKFSSMKYYKRVYTDFSLVNVAVVNHDVVVGARPMRGMVLENVDYSKTVSELLNTVDFKDDFKASGDYRRALAESLLEDIISEMGGHNGN